MEEYPKPLKTARPTNINEIIINLALRDAYPVGLSQFGITIDAENVGCCDNCNAESAWLVVEIKNEDGYNNENERELSIWCGNCVPEEFRELWNANPQNPPAGF